MPMTAAIAPTFAARYPEAAIIFDNLHSMHDVVSDILANSSVPRDRKRTEILLAARRFRDDTSYVMPVAAWRTMSAEMGVENMGGLAVNIVGPLPTPSVTRGAVMQHDDSTGKMTGMTHGSMTGTVAGMDHSNMPGMAAASTAPATDHATMGHATSPMRDTTHGGAQEMGAMHNEHGMADLHMRMLHDPVIRARVMADSAMRRIFTAGMATMPAEQRVMMADMLRADSLAARRSDARRVPPKPTAPKRTKQTKATPQPAPAAKKYPQTSMDYSGGARHRLAVG